MQSFEQLAHLAMVAGQYRLADHDSPSILAAQIRLGLSNWRDCTSYQVEAPEEAFPIFAAPLLPIQNDATAEREWQLWVQFADEHFADIATDEPYGLVIVSEQLTAEQVASVLPNAPQIALAACSIHELLPAWEHALTQPNAPQHWYWLCIHAGCSLEALQKNEQLAHRDNPEGHIATDALTWCTMQYLPTAHAMVVQAEEVNWADIQQKPVTALSALRAECPRSMHAPWLHNSDFSRAGYIERFKAQQHTEFELAKQPLALEELSMQQALGEIGVCALPVQLCLQQHFLRKGSPLPFNTYHEQQQRIGWWLTD